MSRNGRKPRQTGIMGMLDVQRAAFGLGLKLFETGAHSANVITRRSTMLAAAMMQPARLADPEFVRMVQEKAEAAGEAWLCAARHTTKAVGPTPADAMALTAAGLALAESCLLPYHRRVRANARRLNRKR